MSNPPEKSKKPATSTLSDQDFSGSGFEDALFLFWRRNRDKIQLTLLALLLIAVGALGFKAFQRKQLEKTQAAYLAAVESGETAAFAQKYSSSPLAGLVLLQSADKAFEQEDFTQAIANYTEASAALKGTVIEGRAQLGVAIANIYAGNNDQGKSLLSSIAQNPKLLNSDRAEAAYHLAIIELNAGEIEAAGKQLTAIETLDDSGFWGQKANLLRKASPQLNDTEAPSRVE
jgi:hypothetical protein